MKCRSSWKSANEPEPTHSTAHIAHVLTSPVAFREFSTPSVTFSIARMTAAECTAAAACFSAFANPYCPVK